MKNYLIILFLLSTPFLISQESFFVNGDSYFESGYYPEAIEAFLTERKNCEKKNKCDAIWLKIALSYYKLHNYKAALIHFNKITDRSTWVESNYLTYFLTLRINKEYKKAEQLFLESKINVNHLKKEWFDTSTLELNKDFLIYETNINSGRSFSGITKYSSNYLISMEFEPKEEESVKYLLSELSLKNDSIFTVKSILEGVQNKETYYQGNPMCYNDSILYFVQNRSKVFWYNEKNREKKKLGADGGNLLSIYSYNKKEVKALNKINLESANSVTPFVFKDEGKEILLFASDRKTNNGNYDLFYSIKQGNNDWSEPKEIEGVNTYFDEVYPSFSDGKLYFSSRAYNNYGGLDVFEGQLKVEGDKITVKSIKNLGYPINSSFDDFGIYWESLDVGFIGSNRGVVSGRVRVYKFKHSSKTLIEGILLDKNGDPISATMYVSKIDADGVWTIVDSLEIGEDGVYSYRVSKEGEFQFKFVSKGFEDKIIYFFNAPEEKYLESINQFKKIIFNYPLFEGTLKDMVTEKPLPGSIIKIYEIKDGERILVAERVADKNGNWDFEFERDKEYEIEIISRDYDLIKFDISNDEFQREFDFERMSKVGMTSNATIRIENIYFDYNSAEITEASFSILENIIKYLETKPTVKIELSAHTDCVGSDDYNKKLSQKRAESCCNYLINKGVDKKRLVPKGYGEKYLLNSCRGQRKDENLAKINRRIEVKILK